MNKNFEHLRLPLFYTQNGDKINSETIASTLHILNSISEENAIIDVSCLDNGSLNINIKFNDSCNAGILIHKNDSFSAYFDNSVDEILTIETKNENDVIDFINSKFDKNLIDETPELLSKTTVKEPIYAYLAKYNFIMYFAHIAAFIFLIAVEKAFNITEYFSHYTYSKYYILGFYTSAVIALIVNYHRVTISKKIYILKENNILAKSYSKNIFGTFLYYIALGTIIYFSLKLLFQDDFVASFSFFGVLGWLIIRMTQEFSTYWFLRKKS